MIVNIPIRCCEILVNNNKILPLIDITPFTPKIIENFQLTSVNILFNNDIIEINVLLFCIWFINVLMFIDLSSKK
mgnify:CR=1 FL=1